MSKIVRVLAVTALAVGIGAAGGTTAQAMPHDGGGSAAGHSNPYEYCIRSGNLRMCPTI